MASTRCGLNGLKAPEEEEEREEKEESRSTSSVWSIVLGKMTAQIWRLCSSPLHKPSYKSTPLICCSTGTCGLEYQSPQTIERHSSGLSSTLSQDERDTETASLLIDMRTCWKISGYRNVFSGIRTPVWSCFTANYSLQTY